MQKPQTIDQPFNLAFLGCGFATSLHSKTLANFKNEIRCYYASRDENKAINYNRKYQGQGYFDSYEAAIHSKDIDIVLVATPPSQHLDLTLQALDRGKHVIVEKPPFLNSADFALVRKMQQTSGCQVFVAENYFYKPLAFKLRTIIHSNVIGEILFIHINALKKQSSNNWRDDTALAGGGALFEGGIHWINFISNLGFTIKSAHGFCPGLKKGLEKSIFIAIEYQEGAVGTFYYSWETPSLFKGLRLSKIYGKNGSITFESNGIFILVHGKKTRIIFPGFRDIAGYKGMFQDFIRALRQDKEPQFNLTLAEKDLRLIEIIYDSLTES